MIHALDWVRPEVGGTDGKAHLPFKKAAWAGFGKPGDDRGKSIPNRPGRSDFVQLIYAAVTSLSPDFKIPCGMRCSPGRRGGCLRTAAGTRSRRGRRALEAGPHLLPQLSGRLLFLLQ